MFSGQRANADFLAGGQRNKAHDRGEGANLAQDARVRSWRLHEGNEDEKFQGKLIND